MAKPSGDGGSVEIWGLNDTAAPVAAHARIRLFDYNGALSGAETIPSALPPGSATLLASRPLARYGGEQERRTRFLDLALMADDGGPVPAGCAEAPPANTHFFATFAESPPLPAKLEVSPADPAYTAPPDGSPASFRFTVTTDRPAFFTWLELERIPGKFSDNSFTLLPGEPRTIAFAPKDPDFLAAETVGPLRPLVVSL